MQPSVEKLAGLRNSMKENNIDAFLIPNSDPHMSEYVTDYWRINRWLTGFTGSASTVVVTDSFAGLWTDSRYFAQAEKQLAGSGFTMMKSMPSEGKEPVDWITRSLKPGSTVGLDGRIFSIGRLRKLERLTRENGIIINVECDLITELWSDRPIVPALPAFDHLIEFCGKDRAVKMEEVREEMRRLKVDYHLLTSLDDIMWLLNIRGNDLKHSPLLLSFAIIDQTQILLFTEEGKIPFRLALEFDKAGIIMLPYEETAGMVTTLDPGSSILITPETTSAELYNSIPKGMQITEDISIPTRMKAVKNSTEIENIGRVMVKDGAALTKFFFWIEHNSDSVPMSELSLSEKLTHFRSEQEYFLNSSFTSIIAYNEHGALPHYSATSETDSVVGEPGILLVDSGGQYLDGTTDITRTISLGRPTQKQKTDYTLVLKGNINLTLAKFPVGTRGSQLDILARKALWQRGLNYGHGTGHGVGFCLNVHEGPQSISPAANDAKASIEAGMLISNEPAIYREGEYGIRIENLILCYEGDETQFGKFLKFDTVSLCYIDKNLIEISLLDKSEIDWLNSYHSEVYEKISPHLSKEERDWLKDKTRPL